MISYWQFCTSHLHGRYALLVALVVIVSVAAMAFLSRNAALHVGPAGWSV